MPSVTAMVRTSYAAALWEARGQQREEEKSVSRLAVTRRVRKNWGSKYRFDATFGSPYTRHDCFRSGVRLPAEVEAQCLELFTFMVDKGPNQPCYQEPWGQSDFDLDIPPAPRQ